MSQGRSVTHVSGLDNRSFGSGGALPPFPTPHKPTIFFPFHCLGLSSELNGGGHAALITIRGLRSPEARGQVVISRSKVNGRVA
jgi:hypothetical protein